MTTEVQPDVVRFSVIVRNPSTMGTSGWWFYIHDESGREVHYGLGLTRWGARWAARRKCRQLSRWRDGERIERWTYEADVS